MLEKRYGIKNFMEPSLTSIYDIQMKLKKFPPPDRAIKNPKVSIIIPTYNNEIYLAKCLFSLTEQTLKEIEIIVINDGSTDNTSSILNVFAEYDKRFKIINQPHSKQGAARNNGTSVATGEYVGFVDSDDWVDLNYYEKLYNSAKKYDSDIALATNVRIGNGKTKKRINIVKEVYVTTLQDKIDISNQIKNPCPTNKIYRRKMLLENKITWPEGVYCEDKLFTMQAIYYANGLVTVPNVNYYYYRNPNSTVNSKNKTLIKDKNNAKRSVLEFLKEKNANIRDKDFWAIVKEIKFCKIPFYTEKESLYTKKFLLCGINIFEKNYNGKYDYKRKRVKILGASFTYKTKKWLTQANKNNIENNRINLMQPKGNGSKNILFIASNFVKAGGIETRLLQYISQIIPFGWNCYILSENNDNIALNNITNFKLNFDATNFDECLNEIIAKYNINVIEFQFKNPKILKNLNLDMLKDKVRLGCVIHNLGITDFNLINKFNYKIMVSKFMYENHYSHIKNAEVIQNCIDTYAHKNKNSWTYKGQNKAILITRIATDKLKSIECFIKYCKENNIDFLIAGEENTSKLLKEKLIIKYKLQESVFIGQVNTIEYLNEHMDNILFVAGVGMVILEALYLNYPCFCCSDSKWKNYSFITDENISLFDNFTIRKESIISQKKQKEFFIDTNNINRYQLRHYIIDNRNLKFCSKKYINIIEDRDGK